MIQIHDAVQFNEKHKWCGCLGIVSEVKPLSDGNVRYMVGVPLPQQGTAYIFATDGEVELIGRAELVGKEDGDG